MSDDDSKKLATMKEIMKEIIRKMGILELEPNEKEISKFCNLIDDINELYFDKEVAIKAGFEDKVIPPGYVMNFTVPATHNFIISGGSEFVPGIIKGVIHVGSIVEYYNPMTVNKGYIIKTEVSDPVKKTGSKGSYYSVIIKLSILNEKKDMVYAIDNHEFFFKLS